ncbi:permease prefix domain 1-containing protein [Xylanimonas sp. McL0601]|uniref:permease prefix domain 1-containing protein n=1 Tax=Xylanimonas sp. McL0601 TaxID=3414739 RepID=UPI003CE6FAE4
MTTVHRLLDEAFAGVPLTPEVADLKEEIRAGLLDRAAELEATGLSADEAAQRALAELGDVDALISEVTDSDRPAIPTPTGEAAPEAPRRRSAWADSEVLMAQHRVRPNPRFVVALVLASVVTAGAIVGFALAAIAGAVALPAALAVVAGLAVGWIIGSSLAQETTTNHPLPRSRAALWGTAGALVTTGIGLGLVALPAWGPPSAVAWIIVGGLAVVVGAAMFTWLGVTQTNRRKAWARQMAHDVDGDNRFAQDPAAAARFGLYTAVIWVIALVATGVLGFTVGWRWSWLALVGGWAVMMLLLAQMLFGNKTKD